MTDQVLPGDMAGPPARAACWSTRMNVDPAHEDEFNEWYDHEHIPSLAKVPGTLCARRFKDLKGTHRYLALYHLQSADVPLTDAWKKAAGGLRGPSGCGRTSRSFADFDERGTCAVVGRTSSVRLARVQG